MSDRPRDGGSPLGVVHVERGIGSLAPPARREQHSLGAPNAQPLRSAYSGPARNPSSPAALPASAMARPTAMSRAPAASIVYSGHRRVKYWLPRRSALPITLPRHHASIRGDLALDAVRRSTNSSSLARLAEALAVGEHRVTSQGRAGIADFSNPPRWRTFGTPRMPGEGWLGAAVPTHTTDGHLSCGSFVPCYLNDRTVMEPRTRVTRMGRERLSEPPPGSNETDYATAQRPRHDGNPAPERCSDP